MRFSQLIELLIRLRRSRFVKIAGQKYLWIPAFSKDEPANLDYLYIVSYFINKSGLPEKYGRVVHCGRGLDMEIISRKIEEDDRKNWGTIRQAYAVCMKTKEKEKVASPT